MNPAMKSLLLCSLALLSALPALGAIEESNITSAASVTLQDRLRVNTADGLTRLATLQAIQAAMTNWPSITTTQLIAERFDGNAEGMTNLPSGSVAWQPALASLGSSNLAVAFMGDSWIYGGASGQKPYVAALLTNRFYAGRVVASTNAGCDGHNIDDVWGQWTNGGVKAWTEAQIALGRTVHVHLEAGINVAGYSYPSNHVLVYSNFCKAVRATGAKVVAYTIPPTSGGATTAAGSWGDQFRLTKNRLVRELADENRVRLWDFLIDLGAWLNNPFAEPYKAGDAVHLSEPYGWLEMALFADAELFRGAQREAKPLLLSSGTIAFPVVEGNAVNSSFALGTINFQRSETNVAFWGTGTNQPEGNVIGQVGSFYVCLSDGTVWAKTEGASNTGWEVVGTGTSITLASNENFKLTSPTDTVNNGRPAFVITNIVSGSRIALGDIGYGTVAAHTYRGGLSFVPGALGGAGVEPSHNQPICTIIGGSNITIINVPATNGVIQFARGAAQVVAEVKSDGQFYINNTLPLLSDQPGNGGGLTNLASTSLAGAIRSMGTNGANTQPGIQVNGLVSGSVPAVTIATNAYVGIGKSNPAYALDVVGNIKSSASIYCESGSFGVLGDSGLINYFSGYPKVAVNVTRGVYISPRSTEAEVFTVATNGVIGQRFTIVTNGVTFMDAAAVPTNSILPSSASGTNWTACVIGGLPRLIATNYGAAGKFLKCVGETVSEW